MPSHVGTHGCVLMVNKGATMAIKLVINANYWLSVVLMHQDSRNAEEHAGEGPQRAAKMPIASANSRQSERFDPRRALGVPVPIGYPRKWYLPA